MPEKPLALSDDQMTALINAAQPLQRINRGEFLRSVADCFAGRSEVGHGELHRVIAEVQRRYFTPPSINEGRPPHVLRKIGRAAG